VVTLGLIGHDATASESRAASHASISTNEYDQLREPTLVLGGPSPRRCLRLRVSSLIPRYLAAPGKFVRPRGRDAASSSLRNRARKSSSSDWWCSVGILASLLNYEVKNAHAASITEA
jgi:hypothetical protein